MRFFPILDLHHLVLAFFLGLAGALVIFLAFRYGERHRQIREEGDDSRSDRLVEETEDIRGGDNSIPPVLVFLFVGFLIWFICYVVFFGFLGEPM
jgi:hypothetical protein